VEVSAKAVAVVSSTTRNATNRRGNIRRHQRSTLIEGTCLLYLSFVMPKAAKENLYQAVNQGSGTFLITKPKRKAAKRRQSKLKGTVRGARKS